MRNLKLLSSVNFCKYLNFISTLGNSLDFLCYSKMISRMEMVLIDLNKLNLYRNYVQENF